LLSIVSDGGWYNRAMENSERSSRKGVSRRGFLKGDWTPERRVQNSADDMAIRRADFARQISDLVQKGQSDRALEFIEFAKKAQEGTPETDTRKVGTNEETHDEISFLNELQENVLKVSKKQKTETV